MAGVQQGDVGRKRSGRPQGTGAVVGGQGVVSQQPQEANRGVGGIPVVVHDEDPQLGRGARLRRQEVGKEVPVHVDLDSGDPLVVAGGC
jgi:hypothetical protein